MMPDASPGYLDWLSQNAGVRDSEIEFHERLHKERAYDEPYLRRQLVHTRLRLLDLIEARVGSAINGDVLDIGCGSGYLAVHLAKTRPIRLAHAMEVTKAAVEHLIPRLMALAGIEPGKVVPVRGSFASIPAAEAYDFIFSFGAIHHSANLLRTLESCARALRPGGYFVAQEPATPDFTTNGAFEHKYQSLDQGPEGGIMNGDRDDHFFRECEYKTAAHYAGFELVCFDDVTALRYGRQSWRGRVDQLRGRGPKTLIDTGDGLPRRPILMICRKPLRTPSSIPHRWV